MNQFFRVKNFEKYQHYADRSPPWIKLYNSILDSYSYYKLSDTSRSHLIAIMLLASRTNNKLPYDEKWIRETIRAKSRVMLQPIFDADFLEFIDEPNNKNNDLNDAPLSTCKHDASNVLDQRERQRERQSREKETNKEKASGLVPAPLPSNLNTEAWIKWLDHRRRNRKPAYKTNKMAEDLAILSHSKQAECVDYSITREYAGLFPDKFKVVKQEDMIETYHQLKEEFSNER